MPPHDLLITILRSLIGKLAAAETSLKIVEIEKLDVADRIQRLSTIIGKLQNVVVEYSQLEEFAEFIDPRNRERLYPNKVSLSMVSDFLSVFVEAQQAESGVERRYREVI